MEEVESRVWKREACPWGTTTEVKRLRTNRGHIRVDSREGIGRVESGTETEKMSGTYFPDKVEEHFPSESGCSFK